MAKGMAGAALAALMLAGAPAAAQRTLTMAVQTPPSALDPHYHNTTNNTMMLMQIYERLFELDNKAVPQPRLAESMRAIDDRTWEIRLRQGVRFHDGTPLEAEDIPYTFARIPTVPNSPALYTPAVRTISRIEIVNPSTIRLHTHEPNPLMHFDMAAPFILSRRIHGPNPATSDFTSGRLAIGTGPYRLVSFAQNERLEIRRNETYWGPAEPWERVTVRFIPQAAARTAALLAGEVDLIDYVPVQDVENLRRDPRFALFEVDSVTFVYLFPDSMRDTSPFVADRAGNPLPRNPLADRRVREALSLAINREAIATRLYQGLAAPADQFAAPIAEHRLPTQGPLPHDLARARALLAEAGYPDGFRLTIHGPNGFFPSDQALLQALAQQFTRAGVETTVQALPPANLFTRATNREFSLFMTYFSSFLTINPLRQVVATRNPEAGLGPFNRQRYSNPAIDEPLREALITMDPERRQVLTHQAARALLEDKGVLPVIFLRNTWAGRRDRVVYDPSPLNHTSAVHARPPG
ncbi:ABC transporter substrate-binding protein [Roseomonas alkaliterrae]|jgi:peptide/nickel transport system substrate-binding protein|uniref:Peptide/nickel transport system substrate-binding protein n=1 Tax=Neoroseomonas alkaliterrae TaxID=1452450 RepID=A0A840XX76_9PROT|nr:ABC transporter substrate-binding protein [Neoroseomonas alkaliterrae]MBB5688767.1 peptide/nickel transport system substrate-binding protein [Neoroseomonas alkaliterrae]MBR0675119.1 ABC transporter substrate-binding protein [Neoroseomonas alkaliterrae]